MKRLLRELRASRFRVVPAVQLELAKVSHEWAINAAEARIWEMQALLRDCDQWLAERLPESGRSRQKVESLRQRIAAVPR